MIEKKSKVKPFRFEENFLKQVFIMIQKNFLNHLQKAVSKTIVNLLEETKTTARAIEDAT